MRLKILLFSLFVISILFASCKKDSPIFPDSTATEKPNPNPQEPNAQEPATPAEEEIKAYLVVVKESTDTLRTDVVNVN
ncbi:MAG: hypothetical protein EOP47_16535 [Sphingobacteriaceae bacterium]|nr:MAG: hypothetical protein EOP47_16535 [Sphingobacteriaceae bacterium]